MNPWTYNTNGKLEDMNYEVPKSENDNFFVEYQVKQRPVLTLRLKIKTFKKAVRKKEFLINVSEKKCFTV